VLRRIGLQRADQDFAENRWKVADSPFHRRPLKITDWRIDRQKSNRELERKVREDMIDDTDVSPSAGKWRVSHGVPRRPGGLTPWCARQTKHTPQKAPWRPAQQSGLTGGQGDESNAPPFRSGRLGRPSRVVFGLARRPRGAGVGDGAGAAIRSTWAAHRRAQVHQRLSPVARALGRDETRGVRPELRFGVWKGSLHGE